MDKDKCWRDAVQKSSFELFSGLNPDLAYNRSIFNQPMDSQAQVGAVGIFFASAPGVAYPLAVQDMHVRIPRAAMISMSGMPHDIDAITGHGDVRRLQFDAPREESDHVSIYRYKQWPDWMWSGAYKDSGEKMFSAEDFALRRGAIVRGPSAPAISSREIATNPDLIRVSTLPYEINLLPYAIIAVSVKDGDVTAEHCPNVTEIPRPGSSGKMIYIRYGSMPENEFSAVSAGDATSILKMDSVPESHIAAHFQGGLESLDSAVAGLSSRARRNILWERNRMPRDVHLTYILGAGGINLSRLYTRDGVLYTNTASYDGPYHGACIDGDIVEMEPADGDHEVIRNVARLGPIFVIKNLRMDMDSFMLGGRVDGKSLQKYIIDKVGDAIMNPPEESYEAVLGRMSKMARDRHADTRQRIIDNLQHAKQEVARMEAAMAIVNQNMGMELERVKSFDMCGLDSFVIPDIESSIKALLSMGKFAYAGMGGIRYVMNEFSIEGVMLGPICISVTTSAPYTATVSSESNKSYLGNAHPHASLAGEVCWGDAVSIIGDVVNKHTPIDFIFCLANFLKEGYNPPGAYVRLESWNGESSTYRCPRCGDDHSRTADMDVCEICERCVDTEEHGHCDAHGCYNSFCEDCEPRRSVYPEDDGSGDDGYGDGDDSDDGAAVMGGELAAGPIGLLNAIANIGGLSHEAPERILHISLATSIILGPDRIRDRFGRQQAEEGTISRRGLLDFLYAEVNALYTVIPDYVLNNPGGLVDLCREAAGMFSRYGEGEGGSDPEGLSLLDCEARLSCALREYSDDSSQGLPFCDAMLRVITAATIAYICECTGDMQLAVLSTAALYSIGEHELHAYDLACDMQGSFTGGGSFSRSDLIECTKTTLGKFLVALIEERGAMPEHERRGDGYLLQMDEGYIGDIESTASRVLHNHRTDLLRVSSPRMGLVVDAALASPAAHAGSASELAQGIAEAYDSYHGDVPSASDSLKMAIIYNLCEFFNDGHYRRLIHVTDVACAPDSIAVLEMLDASITYIIVQLRVGYDTKKWMIKNLVRMCSDY